MLKGDAVQSLTMMFLQLWNISVKEKEDYSKYMHYTSVIDRGMRNGGYVVPYGDSPYDDEDVGEKVYLDILNRSQDYVHIMTPYLILDDGMKGRPVLCGKTGSGGYYHYASYSG